MILAFLIRGPAVVFSCDSFANSDTVEKYYRKSSAATPDACCSLCQADASCNFACHTGNDCWLKNATTLTLEPNAEGVTVLSVRGPKPTPALPPWPPLPAPKYKVELVERPSTPTLSFANAPGHGASPCKTTFNPSYVEVVGENKVGGIIVRTDGCQATQGRLSFAECDVMTGVCGDLNASYQFPPGQGTEDPRVIWDPHTEYFYNFAYGTNFSQSKADGCDNTNHACTVVLARTKTPIIASSWKHVPGGTYPWHRNGCCLMAPVGEKSYCIFGESGAEGRGSGIGIAYTTNISTGKFVQTNWTGGVPGEGGVGPWLTPLGEAEEEIKLEAGAHLVTLSTGDHIHFYAAATPGWVANGNYTAGYIILDKNEPTKIIQRHSGQWLVPENDFETLCSESPVHCCGGSSPTLCTFDGTVGPSNTGTCAAAHGHTGPACNCTTCDDPVACGSFADSPTTTCKYQGERKNVIFLCSATPIGKDRFRLFWGGGDGNVGTGVVEVTVL